MNSNALLKLDALRRGLEEALNVEVLSEHQMVGFKLAKGNRRPEVVLRLKVSSYEKKPFEFWVSPMGKKDHSGWVNKLRSLAEKDLPARLAKAPFGEWSKWSGVVEIGSYWEQNSWSDDSYLAIRGDTPELTKAVADLVQKALPVSGGGVPGSTGYKGSGLSGGDTEYIYHYSSFGIGD